MNRTYLLLVLTAACLTLLARRLNAANETTAATPGIAVVFVGQEDGALGAQAIAFLQGNLRCAVRMIPPISGVEDDPEKEAEALAKTMQQQDVLLIALLNMPQKISFASGVFCSKKVAMLNVYALRPANLADAKAKVAFQRRVDTQAMYAVGALAGASDCPNPLCAMHAGLPLDEMGSKVRNFCPPCGIKIGKLLQTLGVRVEE